MSPALAEALAEVVAFYETESRATATVSQQPACPWCADPNVTDYDERLLCRPHEAEFEGLSLAELDRRDEQHLDEFLDTL